MEKITKKTKTKYIFEKLEEKSYERKPLKEFMGRSKQKVRTILLARSGMLECGKNFKGKMSEKCPECAVIDDEAHRMNHCARWKSTNYCGKDEKVNFEDIYSDEGVVLDAMCVEIEKIWNLDYRSTGMKK